MNVLSLILTRGLSLYQTIRKIPWLWKLVTNWRDVEALAQSSRGFLISAQANRGLPGTLETRLFMQSLRVIFEKQLIDFPDLDEIAFAEMLREIETTIVGSFAYSRLSAERKDS